jgi:uracil-DNA glycosylase
MNLVCKKCDKYGLGFYSENIIPEQYIEGNPDADIWIIGLNPKADVGNVERRTVEDFKNFSPNSHPYFSDFRKVSNELYENWIGENSIIAHTDLVKCFSKSFPPKIEINGKLKPVKINKVVDNCIVHLHSQIKKSKPKVIICNGSIVSWEVIRLFPPESSITDFKTLTSYKTTINIDNIKHQLWIVLSGFIGRIDDRNKRRLGKEIENILENENIKLR